MPVPVNPPYKMFDTGSALEPNDTSIRGAQKFDTNSVVSGDAALTFSNNISLAQVPFFDERYAGQITTLSQVSASLQWRNYPIAVSCYECDFTEIDDPTLRTVTYEIVKRDPTVGAILNFNGSVSMTSITKVLTLGANAIGQIIQSSIGPTEQFIGWSFDPQGATGIFNTTFSNTYVVAENITIYAIIDLSNAVSFPFCYYPASTGQTDICDSCNVEKEVFFDRNLLKTTALKDLIWYEDSTLSTPYTDIGSYRAISYITYRILGTTFRIPRIDSIVYSVASNNGVAIISTSPCSAGLIYCT